MFDQEHNTITWRKVDNPNGPLNVLVDVSRLANTRLKYSGISRYTQEIVKGLSGLANVTVHLVLLTPSELTKGDFRNNLYGFSDYLGQRVLMPNQVALLDLHGSTVQFSPYGPLAAIENFVPDVRCVTIHDILHITMSEYYLANNADAHIRRVIASVDDTDYVMADSEYTRMEILQTFDLQPDRISTVALGVSDVYSPQSKTAVKAFCKGAELEVGKYFVLFAQKDPRKNVAATLEGISRFLIDNPKSSQKFLIIGSGVNLDDLQNQFDGLEMPIDRVKMLKAPSDSDLAIAYSGARGFLYPSLGEGFGLPPLEAMSCGCPIITSSLTSLPEVVGAAGLYVSPTSPTSIKRAIERLSQSDETVKELSDAALAESRRFNWEITAVRTVAFFRQALSQIGRNSFDVTTLFDELDGANLLKDPTVWTSLRGELLPTDELANFGRDVRPTLAFFDTEEVGVHAIHYDVKCEGDAFRASVILKPDQTRYAVFWMMQLVGNDDVSKAEVYFDLKDLTVESVRMDGTVYNITPSLTTLIDGWIRVDVDVSWVSVKKQAVRIRLGGRSDNMATSIYEGGGDRVFEVLHTRLSKIDPAFLDDTELNDTELGNFRIIS